MSLAYYLAKFHWKLQENEEIAFGARTQNFTLQIRAALVT